MTTLKNIEALFVAGFGPIVRDPGASRKFYSGVLALPLKKDAGGYQHTGELNGVKHFALWPLAQAAESCFNTDQWPDHLSVPQAWIEFDLANIEKATAELESQGYTLLVAAQKEPWGQSSRDCWDRKACWSVLYIPHRCESDLQRNDVRESGKQVFKSLPGNCRGTLYEL